MDLVSRDANPSASHRDHRTGCNLICVAAKNIGQQQNARPGWHVGQPDKPCMLGAAMNESSKVRVDGYQDSALPSRHRDDRIITWIGAQPRDLDHVVALGSAPVRQAMPGTAINKESHLATWTASRESSARTAWA